MSILKVSEDLRPLSDLKSRASDIVRQVSETGRPVVLTRHGRGVAVVLSIDVFEEFQQAMHRVALQRAVEDAESDLATGNQVAHEEVKTKLERWASVKT